MGTVLVSACLLGRACRHDGAAKPATTLMDALRDEKVDVVPFCPEEAGGLATPRPAANLVGGDGEAVVSGVARVVTIEGRDVTESFLRGARKAVELARTRGCTAAYLQERSPSCGCARVHADRGLIEGCGVTTALLREAGVATISVDGG